MNELSFEQYKTAKSESGVKIFNEMLKNDDVLPGKVSMKVFMNFVKWKWVDENGLTEKGKMVYEKVN